MGGLATELLQELYRSRYSAIQTLDTYYALDKGVPPEGNLVARNICVGRECLSVGCHARANMLEVRDNYVGADPGFLAPEKADFRLRKDSPAWKTGFQLIPTGLIGLMEDEYRIGGVTEARR